MRMNPHPKANKMNNRGTIDNSITHIIRKIITNTNSKARSPSCYPLDQPSDLPGQKQPDIDCEKCQVEAKIQQALTGKAAYIPQCNVRTNRFLPKQCDASTGFCWCSSPYGIEIPNTKTKKKGLVCKKKAKKGHNCSRRAATKGFKPKCNGKSFHEVQCMVKTEFCWCSMKDGLLVPNTVHNKNLKKKFNCAAHSGLKFNCGKRLGNVQHPFDLTRHMKCGAGTKAYACSCPANAIFDPTKHICTDFYLYGSRLHKFYNCVKKNAPGCSNTVLEAIQCVIGSLNYDLCVHKHVDVRCAHKAMKCIK